MRLIPDLCDSLSSFVRKAGNVAVQILRVVDLEHDFTQTALALLVVLALQGTNAETIAQEQFLVERGWQKSAPTDWDLDITARLTEFLQLQG